MWVLSTGESPCAFFGIAAHLQELRCVPFHVNAQRCQRSVVDGVEGSVAVAVHLQSSPPPCLNLPSCLFLRNPNLARALCAPEVTEVVH